MNAVPSSIVFMEFVRRHRVSSQKALLTFDVMSLFTNVEGVCRVALQRLEGDRSLLDRTSLSSTKIVTLMEFILGSNYFFYEWNFKQTDGSACSQSSVRGHH